MRSDPHTGDLLAVDPSIRSTGLALFSGGVLRAATAVRFDSDDEPSIAKCLRVAEEAAEWVARHRARPRVLVVEWPGKSWRGDARDLHGLCGVNGAIAGVLSLASAGAGYALEVVSAEPDEWAGQVPKSNRVRDAKKSPRAMRVAAALAAHPGESEVWTSVKYGDTVDAIGLGLWLLGRFEPRRVYPGCSE